MTLTKVLIAVKTYPTISLKYDELVCTAGFREDGTWIRIYPIQYRKKDFKEQYKKYQWIELELEKNPSDFRPESYRPKTLDTEIKIIGQIDADGDTWEDRRKFVLQKTYTNLANLIKEAKDRSIQTSLAVFKPSNVIDFIWEDVERTWDDKKIAKLKQYNLFESSASNRFDVVRKLPYKFSYVFTDDSGKESTLMIEDWEVGALFWNTLKKYNNEKTACEAVRAKYLNDFAKTKDLYFFLGTTAQFHLVAPNPFVIIGTFHPKKKSQIAFDF